MSTSPPSDMKQSWREKQRAMEECRERLLWDRGREMVKNISGCDQNARKPQDLLNTSVWSVMRHSGSWCRKSFWRLLKLQQDTKPTKILIKSRIAELSPAKNFIKEKHVQESVSGHIVVSTSMWRRSYRLEKKHEDEEHVWNGIKNFRAVIIPPPPSYHIISSSHHFIV